MTASRNRGLLAIAALCSGCIYSFNNPVQQQPNGSISGKVQLQNAVTGQTTLDGGIEVVFSGGLALRLDESGEFRFLALPDGTYALGIYIPPLAANDFPLLATLSGVVLPGAGAAVDAVDLGSISVQPSGLVSGTVTDILGPSSAVIAAFTPATDGGPMTYEAFSAPTDAGHYAFYLPAGNHVLVASNATLAVGVPITVQARDTLTEDFYLDAGGSPANGLVQGSLVFGGPDAGREMLPSGIDLATIQYTATSPSGQMTSGQVFTAGASFTPGLGASFDLPLPAGQPLDIRFVLPAQPTDGGTNYFAPFLLSAIPSLASQTTYLGQVTWLPQSTFEANRPDAGQGGGTTTSGGTSATGTTGGTGGTTGSSTGGSTTGSSTGGTTGATNAGSTSGGSNGGTGTWGLVNTLTLPTVDGGPPNIYGVVALPLPGGGHRLVWAGDTNVYYADDPGMFGPVTAVIDAGDLYPLYNLSATAIDGGSIVAWTSILGGVQAAFIPDVGGLAQPITISPTSTIPSTYPSQNTATFAGSLNGVPGAFVVTPDGVLGGLAVLFTSDNTTFTRQTVSVDTGTGTNYLFTVSAGPCQTSDMFGPGFCYVTSGAYGNNTNFDAGVVLVGEVDTSGASPSPLWTQVMTGLPPNTAAVIVAQGVIAGDAGFSDTVYATAGLNIVVPSVVTSYTSLSTQPTVQLLPATSGFMELILPWGGQPIGFWPSPAPVGVLGLSLPSGDPATDLLPGVRGGYPASNSGFLNGYTDPATGQPTLALSAQDGGSLFIYQLPSPNGTDGGVSDAGGWARMASVPAVDGGAIEEAAVFPLPLGDGGIAKRVLWSQYGTNDLYISDDSSGSFVAPTYLGSRTLIQALRVATDSAGNSMATWQEPSNPGVLYLPASGPIGPPAIDPFVYYTAGVIPMTLGATNGFGVLGAPSSFVLTLHVSFISDALTDAGFDVPMMIDAGECPSCQNGSAMQAAPCDVAELDGGPGFCVTGIATDSTAEHVFVSVVSTAGAAPVLVASQIIYTGGFANLTHPAIVALPPPTPGGPTPVTASWLDSVTSSGTIKTNYAQFTDLSTPPTVVSFTDAGANCSGNLFTLLLPWRGAPLAMYDLYATDTYRTEFLRSLVFPPGTSTSPPNVIGAFGYSPQGYADPQGGLVMTPSGSPGVWSSVDIYQLAP
jgi:hypothetical protein